MKPLPPRAVGDTERADGRDHRNDRYPPRFDPATGPRRPQHAARDHSGDDTAHNAPADRLTDQPRRVGRRGVSGIGLRDGKRDREQRHAQAVVEAALDVQPLTDTRRQVLVGDDGLAQCGVGRAPARSRARRLGPRDRAQHESARQRPDDDRERQADTQQTGRYRVLVSQRTQIDPRSIGEQHDHERRFRERAHRILVERQMQPTESFGAEDKPGDDEHDRRRDRRTAAAGATARHTPGRPPQPRRGSNCPPPQHDTPRRINRGAMSPASQRPKRDADSISPAGCGTPRRDQG